MRQADVWALLRQFPAGAGSAAPAGRRATQAVAPLRRRAAEPPRQAGQAAHSAPRQRGLAGAGAASGTVVVDRLVAAGAGGASAADMVALAGAVPGGAAGVGGGTVPRPNKAGDALGSDGSGNGAAAARCCALVRSAISALGDVGERRAVRLRRASAAHWRDWDTARSAPGGGGLSSAILPPCRSCHQLTGFIDAGNDAHPASNKPPAAPSRRSRRPVVPDTRPQPA